MGFAEFVYCWIKRSLTFNKVVPKRRLEGKLFVGYIFVQIQILFWDIYCFEIKGANAHGILKLDKTILVNIYSFNLKFHCSMIPFKNFFSEIGNQSLTCQVEFLNVLKNISI